MNLAWLSLAALVVAILVSCFSRLNVGILGLAFAWLVGVYVGGMSLADVLAGFPARRRHAALLAGADQRHARQAGAQRRGRVRRQRRTDPRDVLPARRGDRLARAG
jgi:hypothetical protein